MIALTGVLFVAVALRFYGLKFTGIFGVDDGRYILDGYSKFVESQGVVAIFQGKLAELRGDDAFVLADALTPLSQTLREYHPFSPKLGFTYLTTLAMWVGVGLVFAASYVEATAGVLLVVATYILIRCAGSARAAIIGASIMAFSPYAVYYSRNAYPQNTSALFIVAAVIALVYTRENGLRSTRCLIAGVLLGVGFWVHYQAAAAIVALVAVYVYWLFAIARPGFRRALLGFGCIATGFVLVCVLAEGITYPIIMLFRAVQMDYPHGTFFELLAPRLHSQLDFGLDPGGLMVMPYAISRFHGIVGALAMVILGLCAVAIVHRRGWRAVLQSRAFVLLVIPATAITLMYAFKHGQVFRMYLFAFPFWAACLGIVLDRLFRSPGRYPRIAAVVAIAMIAVFAIPPLVEIMRFRSAYPDAITYAREHDVTLVSGWSSTLEAYLLETGEEGGDIFALMEATSVDRLVYVADWQELYYDAYPDVPVLLAGDAPSAITLEHRFGRIFLEAELFHSEGKVLQEIMSVRALDLERARTLHLYALRDRPLKTHVP